MVIEHIYNDEIADYDVAITENQVIFPGEDLGDLPSSYENLEKIDVERQMGPTDPPPLHANALETWTPKAERKSSWPDDPYGFYNTKTGVFNQIILKDKNNTTVWTWGEASKTPSELLTEAKISMAIL